MFMGNKGNFREDERIVAYHLPPPSPIQCLIKESNNNKKGRCQKMITSYDNCILRAFMSLSFIQSFIILGNKKYLLLNDYRLVLTKSSSLEDLKHLHLHLTGKVKKDV